MLDFFEIRVEGRLHPLLYRAVLGSFALVRFWDGTALAGPARGRAFEAALYDLCDGANFALSERAGSRTLCGASSASGLHHESDAVIATSDVIIHIETKHLTEEASKSCLLEFNQKGLDFVLSGALALQRRPVYRMLVSGGTLSREARRFAALWGIITVEPELLPMPLLHWLAGSTFPSWPGAQRSVDRIWREVPAIVVPLQERLKRLPLCLLDHASIIAPLRIDAALDDIQEQEGNRYWRTLDTLDPYWLERIYAVLAKHSLPDDIGRDGVGTWMSRARREQP
jgi:hypothetical protein